jgi:hypothetical protein
MRLIDIATKEQIIHQNHHFPSSEPLTLRDCFGTSVIRSMMEVGAHENTVPFPGLRSRSSSNPIHQGKDLSSRFEIWYVLITVQH